MPYRIGQQVLFGRPNGEKTEGEIVGATRTGKLKIRQIGNRGRHDQHEEGQIWTVPEALVSPLHDEERLARLPIFQVPLGHAGWAFSLDARQLLSRPEGWGEIVALAMNAAGRLYKNNPRTVLVRGAWDVLREDRFMLWFEFSPDGIRADDVAELGLLFDLSSHPWVTEGPRPLAVAQARPLCLVHDGEAYMLVAWEEGEAPGEYELVEPVFAWEDGPTTLGEVFTGSPTVRSQSPRAVVEFVLRDPASEIDLLTSDQLAAGAMYDAVGLLRKAGATSRRVYEWRREHLPPDTLRWWGLLDDEDEPTPLLHNLVDQLHERAPDLLPVQQRKDVANAVMTVATLAFPPTAQVAAVARAVIERVGVDPSIYAEVLGS